MPYMIHPYYTGRDKGPVSVGCDCLAGAMGAPNRYPDHARECAIFTGDPLLFDTIEAAQTHATEKLGYGKGTFQIEPEQPEERDDPEVLAFLALLGADKEWVDRQHECSEGAELDHLASIRTLGACPFCGAEERA